MKLPSFTCMEYALLTANIIPVLYFSYIFLSPPNYEFLIYIGAIVIFFVTIFFTRKKCHYPNPLLWLLTLWAFLHMAGGGFSVDGIIWYKQILIPLVSEPYNILRYDQFIHMFGFFTATIVSYYLVSPHLKNPNKLTGGLLLVLVMAGIGFGALNEVIEFAVDTLVPESGVGGYINTSLDLVSNLIGALLAAVFLKLFVAKEK